MSKNKRRQSLEEATKDIDIPQPAASPKRPRLISVTNLERHGYRMEPRVVHHDRCKPFWTPAQSFRRHRQGMFFSKRASGSNGIKRASRVSQRPKNLSTQFSPNSFPYCCPPEFFDVSPRLRDAIPPADGEMSLWKDGHAAFINSSAGIGGTHWIGKRPLGSGGFGTAGLWERRDENNAVIEVL